MVPIMAEMLVGLEVTTEEKAEFKMFLIAWHNRYWDESENPAL